MKFEPDAERYLIASIRRFFADEMEDDIGDLKAARVLEFFVKEIGPSVYDQAIADAQAFLQDKVSDLGGVHYEPEFNYWTQFGKQNS
jgi:uncharacterized protein (DUF2164 family)